MADTITIPSPRVFLTGSPPIESSDPPAKSATNNKPKQVRKRNTTTTKAKTTVEKSGENTAGNGVEKKKQSKSRNGMFTLFTASSRPRYESWFARSMLTSTRLCYMQGEKVEVR